MITQAIAKARQFMEAMGMHAAVEVIATTIPLALFRCIPSTTVV